MGMSASQARLLSLTTRLTNNELQSQITTNAKLRLAEKSSAASMEYMEALNSQKLVFGLYNDNGDYSDQNLTANVIYNYEPLKSQYALMNSSGKILVSSKDAENYKNSDNLHEFLKEYGVLENADAFVQYEEDLVVYNNQMEQYEIDKAQYDIDKKEYDKEYAVWKPKYDAWLEAQKQPDLYAMFSGIVGTSENPTAYCYEHALKGDSGCYKHLLNHLLDFEGTWPRDWTNIDYTTSSGVTFKPDDVSYGGMGTANELKDVSKALDTKFCDGKDELSIDGETNVLQTAKDQGREPTEIEVLKSDWIDNGDGTYDKKSLKQKAIDMYYILQNNLITDKDEMKDMLINFTDGDMKKVTPEEPGEEPKAPVAPIEPSKPEEPGLIVNDKDKAQWYVNLWHGMNNSETANKVDTKKIEENNAEKSVFIVEDSIKASNGGMYEVLDENLASNTNWLQFALEHGTVTLAKAQFDNPAVNSGKISNLTSDGITWEKIIYTSASDIQAKDDEVAIALAEVKYKNTVQEIQSEDKKYDQDLKQLDTEHNALQSEYESLKSVISKNVERSFKVFS